MKSICTKKGIKRVKNPLHVNQNPSVLPKKTKRVKNPLHVNRNPSPPWMINHEVDKDHLRDWVIGLSFIDYKSFHLVSDFRIS